MAGLRSAMPLPRTSGFVCRSCCRSIRRSRRYATVVSPKDELPEIYDVVCVGGGPAGLSLLTALRASKSTSALKVALVESQDLNKTRRWKLPPDQYSNRVSSLTPTSVGFLDEIGAWRHINRPRVQSYTEMEVWDGLSEAHISFDWSSPGSPSYSPTPQGPTKNIIAYMTENLNLTSALLARLSELGPVAIFDNTRVEGITYGPDTSTLDLRTWPIVQLSNGKSIAARLLVGADGANSPVRSFAGIQSRGWDYNRHGVVATMELERSTSDEEKIAYQRFLPTGPIALLPLPNNFATLVWSTLPHHASHLKSLPPADFTALVNAAFRLSPTDLAYLLTLPTSSSPSSPSPSSPSAIEDELSWRLQHTPPPSARLPLYAKTVHPQTIASFPLKLRHANTYTIPRVALVGDAAHTIHPLAGQGLNQGQLDVQALFRSVAGTVAVGGDIGAEACLGAYEAERYAENALMGGVVDKLHKLYSSENAVVVGARSLGLSAVDAWGGLKGLFMGVAAGGSTGENGGGQKRY